MTPVLPQTGMKFLYTGDFSLAVMLHGMSFYIIIILFGLAFERKLVILFWKISE